MDRTTWLLLFAVGIVACFLPARPCKGQIEVEAYISNAVSNSVSVIDTGTNTVGAVIPVGSLPYGIAVTPDGRFVYVANSGGTTLSVINAVTNTLVGSSIPVGNSPQGVALTPDGKFIYVTNGTSNTVSVIDTATNSVVAPPIPVGLFPRGVAVTPDGKFAYVANTTSNTVSVIDTTTNAVIASPAVESLPCRSCRDPGRQVCLRYEQ